MTTAFTAYGFLATGASTPRTMPARLNDIINVKDFGAVGDGSTDDSTKINAAIEYAMQRGTSRSNNGTIVYFPPGTYRVNSPVILAITSNIAIDPTGGKGWFGMAGAGRGVSIIRGDINNISGRYPYVLQKDIRDNNYDSIGLIQGLTIWNESVVSGSGAILLTSISNTCRVVNCTLVGMHALGVADAFGSSVEDCEFVCPAAIDTANSSARGVRTRGFITSTGVATTSKVRLVVSSTAGFVDGNSYSLTTLTSLSINPGTGAYRVSPTDSTHIRLIDYPLGFGGGQITIAAPAMTAAATTVATGFIDLLVPDSSVFQATCTVRIALPVTASVDLPSGSYALHIVNGTTLETVTEQTLLKANTSIINPGHSVACTCFQTEVSNCKATGFDIAYAFAGPCSALLGCTATRCNTGVITGFVAGYGIGTQSLQGTCIQGCRFDRCLTGIYNNSTSGFNVVGNVWSGTDGPATPSAMTLAFSGGTVTATSTGHNLPAGISDLIIVTNPINWTPDLTGTQKVTVTNTGANTFTYSLGSAGGTFVSATWNYSQVYGITNWTINNAFFAANVLPDPNLAYKSFDMANDGGHGDQVSIDCWAMRGSWAPNPHSVNGAASWKFEQCWMTSNAPPVAYLNFGDLPGAASAQQRVEGMEYTVVDAVLQATFAGTVTAGSSSNHYKLRYDGTNWRRVG